METDGRAKSKRKASIQYQIRSDHLTKGNEVSPHSTSTATCLEWIIIIYGVGKWKSR